MSTPPHIRTCIQIGPHGAMISCWLPTPFHDVALEMLDALEHELKVGGTQRSVEIVQMLIGLVEDANLILIGPPDGSTYQVQA